MGQQAEQKDLAGKKDRKSIRTRKKSKRGDSKVESNDSPEILDRGGGRTSDIPSLPSRDDDGPDFSEEAWVPVDASFVSLQTDLTGASEDIQVRSV